VGVFADRLVRAHGRLTQEQYKNKLVAELEKRLSLDAAQLTQVKAIFDATGVRFREIHKKIQPDLDALRTGHDDQVRAILNERQRAEYDKWRAEREKKRAAEQR
jgi:capsule polysaccharide export protein KpsE/RkpR